MRRAGLRWQLAIIVGMALGLLIAATALADQLVPLGVSVGPWP